MKSMNKTNVMRLLDQKKAVYLPHSYADTDALSGMEVAAVLGQDPNRVFKTLVTESPGKQHYVFLVPVCRELNLKKAAQAVGEKKLEMLKAKLLLPLTGYVHGGCSSIGMKKPFPTVIHSTAGDFDTIFFSAGKIGYQVELSLTELEKALSFRLEDVAD